MKYVCNECGKVFEEDEIVEVEESRGEYWGVPAYETVAYSPCCEASFEEFYPCCEYCQSFTGTKDTTTGEIENGCELTGKEVDKCDLCKNFELAEGKRY